MIKSLKWAYDLGVRQERVRIASYLKSRAGQALLETNAYYQQTSDPKVLDKRKDDILKKVAVEQQVLQIINEILEPQWEQSMSNSIMFPIKENK